MAAATKRSSNTRYATIAFLFLAACGNYVGYGDFSDVAYEDLDWVEITTLVVQCTNDNGYAVQQSSAGDGVFMDGGPGQDQKRASEVMERCEQGLNLPDPAG